MSGWKLAGFADGYCLALAKSPPGTNSFSVLVPQLFFLSRFRLVTDRRCSIAGSPGPGARQQPAAKPAKSPPDTNFFSVLGAPSEWSSDGR